MPKDRISARALSMVAKPSASWFAVAVLNHRKATAGMEDLGYPVFCPMQRSYKRTRGRKVATDSPLFPGYFFTQFDRDTDGWGEIDHIDGVLGILRNGTTPIRIPGTDIDRLRVAESIGVFDKTKPPKVGIEVEATDGPFAGWIGKIVRARSSDRVDVLLGFLGGVVEVNMPLSSLRGTE